MGVLPGGEGRERRTLVHYSACFPGPRRLLEERSRLVATAEMVKLGAGVVVGGEVDGKINKHALTSQLNGFRGGVGRDK